VTDEGVLMNTLVLTLYNGQHLHSEISFNFHLIIVCGFCHNISRKCRFTKVSGWKRYMFYNPLWHLRILFS